MGKNRLLQRPGDHPTLVYLQPNIKRFMKVEVILLERMSKYEKLWNIWVTHYLFSNFVQNMLIWHALYSFHVYPTPWGPFSSSFHFPFLTFLFPSCPFLLLHTSYPFYSHIIYYWQLNCQNMLIYFATVFSKLLPRSALMCFPRSYFADIPAPCPMGLLSSSLI